MKYASEVINLLASNQRSAFRMAHFVRNIDEEATGRDRQRIRNGVLRVLEELEHHGTVTVERSDRRGAASLYRWKVPHEDSHKCHVRCHNRPEHNCAYRL